MDPFGTLFLALFSSLRWFYFDFAEKASDETWAVFVATHSHIHPLNIPSKLIKYRFDVGNLHNELIIYILNDACNFSWNIRSFARLVHFIQLNGKR